MNKIEFGTRLYHLRRKLFAKATGDVLTWDNTEYFEVIYESDSVNGDRNYWNSERVIKVESEKHALELMLRS